MNKAICEHGKTGSCSLRYNGKSKCGAGDEVICPINLGLVWRRIFEDANKNMSDVERMMGGAVRVSLFSVATILEEVGAEFHAVVDYPYPKVKKMRALVKKHFGDAKRRG